MNLDDLISVWRSQDASPLHGVNETLLRLALQQDEARLQARRRKEAWITYLLSAFLVGFMAVLFVILYAMLYSHRDFEITGWDFAVPIVGAIPALLMCVALYVSRRTQAEREQRFGDSLRDQLGRRISQLSYEATTSVWWVSMLISACFVGGIAIRLAGTRVNMQPDQPFPDWVKFKALRLFLVGAVTLAVAVWGLRRSVQRDVLPHKLRLEALLKELDSQ